MNTAAYRPIIFSSPMVRAIQNGSKDQTRRLVKEGPNPEERRRIYCYRGDRLWVREAFARDDQSRFLYRADGIRLPEGQQWKPSIHMPKAACRLILAVTLVSVQKLQDITGPDALAEGIDSVIPDPEGVHDFLMGVTHSPEEYLELDPVTRFRLMWQSLHGPQSWEDNPSVWVIRFQRLQYEALSKALSSLRRVG